MKRIIVGVGAAAVLLFGLNIVEGADAGTAYGDYLYYRVNADNASVTITSCNKSATEVTIPSEIDGMPVTSIGENAFMLRSNLKNVIISEGVTSIEPYAFCECGSLTGITIPDSVVSIGEGAFGGCESLEGVYISDMDAWCRIEFGRDISSPMAYADKLYLNNEPVTSVTIPEGITKVQPYAFSFDTLTSITIPDSVTSIELGAFRGCTGLTSVVIPDSVAYIGTGAFDGCTNLVDVTIGKNVATIGYHAFENCTGLIDVYYSGSEEEWNAISIGKYNECLINATIHFNSTAPTPLPLLPAVIASADNGDVWSFDISVADAYENSKAQVAIYSENGQLVAVKSAELDSEGKASVDVAKMDGESYAKVFVWVYDMQPTTKVETIAL